MQRMVNKVAMGKRRLRKLSQLSLNRSRMTNSPSMIMKVKLTVATLMIGKTTKY